MDDHAPSRDPIFPRHQPDFTESAELVAKRNERDRRRVPHGALPASETAYTTEWQMESGFEAVPLR